MGGFYKMGGGTGEKQEAPVEDHFVRMKSLREGELEGGPDHFVISSYKEVRHRESYSRERVGSLWRGEQKGPK